MTSTSARAAQIAAFYARHAGRLRRIVAAKVNAPAVTIEDACQTAWAALVRRDDVSLDHRGVNWLATVAIHEGWRLVSGIRDVPMGAIRAGLPTEGELPEPEAAEPGTEEQAIARIEHAERVAAFREAKLKPREREALVLQALGYSYKEIAEATGSTYTAVNRRLTEGRARLRRLARDRDQEPDDASDEEDGEGARVDGGGLYRT